MPNAVVVAGCEDCCKGEKCEKCGMQKGTALCCTGVKPAEKGTYCKMCGFEKGSEQCCADGNVKCDKCGLAQGSPICCKIKSEDHEHDKTQGHDGDHDHVGGDHDSDEAEGHDDVTDDDSE